MAPWTMAAIFQRRMMSDRLPGRKPRNDAPVATGAGHPDASAGVNGKAAAGDAPVDAPVASGIRFLCVNGSVGPQDPPDDIDSEFAGRYPACWEYLTVRVFRGQARTTATLLFFREDGQWKCCLCDRDTDRVLFRSGDSLEATLESLEGALASPRADWRPSKRPSRR